MKTSTVIRFFSLANRNQRIGGMCLGIVACILMSPFVVFSLSDVPFLVDGESVEAHVVSPPTVVKGKFSTCYGICFVYEDAAGQQRTGLGTVREAHLQPGDPIFVRYLRNNPARSRTETSLNRSWPSRAFAIVAGCVFVASVWSGFVGIREVMSSMNPNVECQAPKLEVY